MRQFISTFALLGVFVLGLGARAFAETPFDPPEPTANGHYQVAGNWSELKRGWNVLVLKLTDMDQQPVNGATVTVVYDMVGMPMNPPDRPIVEKGDGVYEKQVFLGMRGTWKFDTTVNANTVEDTHSRTQEVTR